MATSDQQCPSKQRGSSMKELTRVNHIGIRVSDFVTSRDFYAQLGFEYITGPSGPEPVAIVEHPCGININFILNANQAEKKNILILNLLLTMALIICVNTNLKQTLKQHFKKF